jgi:hypothetical protein
MNPTLALLLQPDVALGDNELLLRVVNEVQVVDVAYGQLGATVPNVGRQGATRSAANLTQLTLYGRNTDLWSVAVQH